MPERLCFQCKAWQPGMLKLQQKSFHLDVTIRWLPVSNIPNINLVYIYKYIYIICLSSLLLFQLYFETTVFDIVLTLVSQTAWRCIWLMEHNIKWLAMYFLNRAGFCPSLASGSMNTTSLWIMALSNHRYLISLISCLCRSFLSILAKLSYDDLCPLAFLNTLNYYILLLTQDNQLSFLL